MRECASTVHYWKSHCFMRNPLQSPRYNPYIKIFLLLRWNRLSSGFYSLFFFQFPKTRQIRSSPFATFQPSEVWWLKCPSLFRLSISILLISLHIALFQVTSVSRMCSLKTILVFQYSSQMCIHRYFEIQQRIYFSSFGVIVMQYDAVGLLINIQSRIFYYFSFDVSLPLLDS